MTKTRIFAYALVPLIAFLFYLLVDGIKSKIDLQKQIESSEERVIDKLKMIREAQKMHLLVRDSFAGNWDSLILFVKNDTFFNVQKNEIIQPRTKNDPLFYTGTDSIRIEYDTLGAKLVIDQIFPKETFPSFDIDSLMFIPGKGDKTFEIFAGEVEKGGVTVDVVEVVDKFPVDPSRNDENPSPKRWFLRFGSRTDVTLSGNWE